MKQRFGGPLFLVNFREGVDEYQLIQVDEMEFDKGFVSDRAVLVSQSELIDWMNLVKSDSVNDIDMLMQSHP